MVKTLFIKIIRLYKAFFSRNSGVHCRFYPSCSDYAIEAIQEKGALRGAFRAFFRILRCNPFSAGGYDPVKR